MGRYYNGDIEGKFWVGVQSSGDADFFGSEGHAQYLSYHFDKDDHLESIVQGVTECKKKLGKWKIKLDEFFEKNDGYNDTMLWEQLGLNKSKARRMLEWYARLDLGEQILECVKKNGHCSFDAEI